jgi:outer membrane protein
VKNISVILNAVLVIAVGVLFYLFFSQKSATAGAVADEKKGSKNETVAKTIADQKMPEGKIAFIDMDSISMKYEFVKDQGKALNNRSTFLNSQYEKMVMDFQTEYQALQQSAQAGIATQSQLETKQMELQKKQQEILNKENELKGLEMERDKMIGETIRQINEFIKRYNEQYHYEFILSKSSMLNTIVYASPKNDLTEAVVNGLNEEYRAKKAQPKK